MVGACGYYVKGLPVNVKVKGGPLNGRSFDVPTGAATLQHHAAVGGRYVIRSKVATWVPDKGADDVEADA